MAAVEGLRAARVHRSISTRELSALAGVNRCTVEAIEAGRVAMPRFRTMRRLSQALGVEARDIGEFRAAMGRAAAGREQGQ